MRQIWNGIDQLTMPLLALHGTKDRLTAPSGSRALIRAAPSSDKTLRIYDGYFHDLLHEPNGNVVADDILAWIDAHTGGAAVTAPALYAGKLGGDPRGWTQAVELGAGVAEGTRFAGSFALELARPRPIGWHGALTARIAGDYRSAALRPLGAAARIGGSVVGVSGGGAFVTGSHFAWSGGGWVEQPLGPLHAGALVEWSRRTSDTGMHGPLASDLLVTSLSLRLGADRAYWPHAQAGVGPVVSGGLAWVGAARGWLITVGLQLYGAD
jgi:hypothetical protein